MNLLRALLVLTCIVGLTLVHQIPNEVVGILIGMLCGGGIGYSTYNYVFE